MNVCFGKLREDAIIPSKESENAGFDIYACFDEGCMIIQPNQTVMIPTGLCSAFDEVLVGIVEERGSTGTKGMARRAGIIDSGYRGEWFIPITNVNSESIVICKTGYCLTEEEQKTLTPNPIYYPYQKAIAQVIFHKLPQITVREADPEFIRAIASNRGVGALGSSGK